MPYRPKWDDEVRGWLSDEFWKALLGEKGEFDAKVLCVLKWTAEDHIAEKWRLDDLVGQCHYEIDGPREEIRASVERLIKIGALPAEVLSEYDDELIGLDEVKATIDTFVLSRGTEERMVHATGLHLAQKEHVRLADILEVKIPDCKPRYAPGHNPELLIEAAARAEEEWVASQRPTAP